MFPIKAINDIYVDGEQYEELRQSIEERWVWMCLTILKLVRVLGIQRIRVGSAKCYGRGHNCRTPIKHLARLGCNFPARAWGDLASELGTCTCESYADRQMCSSLGSAILLQLPPSGLSQHGQIYFGEWMSNLMGTLRYQQLSLRHVMLYWHSQEISWNSKLHDKTMAWQTLEWYRLLVAYCRIQWISVTIFSHAGWRCTCMCWIGEWLTHAHFPNRVSPKLLLGSQRKRRSGTAFCCNFLPDYRLIGCILSVLRSTRRIAHSAGRSGIFVAIAVAMEGGPIGAYLNIFD